VSAVAFSADGATFASASDDATVRLWAVPGGSCVVSVRFGEPVAALAATRRRDVCYLATSDPVEEVRLHPAEPDKRPRSHKKHYRASNLRAEEHAD